MPSTITRCTIVVASACFGLLPACFSPEDPDAATGTEGGTESSGTTTADTTASSMTSASSTSPTTSGPTSSSTSASTSGPTSTTDADTTATSTSGCAPGTLDCACDSGSCDEGLVCVDDVCSDLGPLLPVPPSEQTFMWQNIQTDFIYESGDTCTGRVTTAMGDRAMCYVGSDNELKCAGAVFDTVWGPDFTGTGEMDVEQVSIRPTFNAANGNGMCLLRSGQIWCMGRNNNNGVYGTGDTNDVPQLTQWGSLSNISRMATGTWDQMCGLTDNGAVYCAGYNFGNSPTQQATGVSTLWVDTFGNLNTDDATVWRASAGRATCRVRQNGLDCQGGGPFGVPLEVVDGTAVEGGGIDDGTCWLGAGGDVECAGAAPPNFEEGRVLALAGNLYTDSLCAVYNDGSLWCVGSNDEGKLGTGDYQDVAAPVESAPAGSVRIDCVLD